MRTQAIISGIFMVFLGLFGVAFYSDWIGPNADGERILKEGRLYLEQDNKHSLRQAVKRFTSLVAEFGNQPLGQEGNFELGVAYEKMGFKREAYLKFRSLYFSKNLYSKDLKERVQFQMGRMQLHQNLNDEGLARFYRLLQSSSNQKIRAKIYQELGEHYLNHNDYRRARENFEVAVMEDPYSDEARLGLSKAYGYLNKDLNAYGNYDSYLSGKGKLSPKKGKISSAYANQALAKGKKLYAQGSKKSSNYYEALNHFKHVYSLNSNNGPGEEALYYSALCFKAIKDLQVAAKYFDMVRSNSVPKYDALALFTKGVMFFDAKQLALAASAFKDFLEKYPKHNWAPKAQAYYNEAMQMQQLANDYVNDGVVTKKDIKPIKNEQDYDPTADYIVSGKNNFKNDSDTLDEDVDDDDDDSDPEEGYKEEKIKGF